MSLSFKRTSRSDVLDCCTEGFGDEDSCQSVSLDQHHHHRPHRDHPHHPHHHHRHRSPHRYKAQQRRDDREADCGDPELNEIASKLQILAAADSDDDDSLEGDEMMMCTRRRRCVGSNVTLLVSRHKVKH